MPDWWPAVVVVGTLVANAAELAWIVRGFKADFSTVRADAAEARRIAEEVRSDQADIQTAVGIQGSKLATIESDMEAMRDTLVTQVEAAVARGLRAR